MNIVGTGNMLNETNCLVCKMTEIQVCVRDDSSSHWEQTAMRGNHIFRGYCPIIIVGKAKYKKKTWFTFGLVLAFSLYGKKFLSLKDPVLNNTVSDAMFGGSCQCLAYRDLNPRINYEYLT